MIAAELRSAGHQVQSVPFDRERIAELRDKRPILRLSDPMMFVATKLLAECAAPYVGPSPRVMALCYDKHGATRVVAQHGLMCPETALGSDASRIVRPAVLKPRWGSDSIGLRLLRRRPVPRSKQTDRFVVQRQVRGTEVTVGVLHGRTGAPLQVCLREGVPYSFLRKYLLRPRRRQLSDAGLVRRVQDAALRIAAVFGVDWAARIDFIHETHSGTLYFLECDVAPLLAVGSAFEMSLTCAGIGRREQIDLLFSSSASP